MGALLMTDTLIIYYSSTGYNERVAQLITNKTNADLFRIEPERAYDTDMWAAWDVAKKEREENDLPVLKSDYPDMSKYQRIMLVAHRGGSPFLIRFSRF